MPEASQIDLSPKPPETTLPSWPAATAQRLADALANPVERRREAVADVVASFPRYLAAWAALGDLGRDDVEAYACYRVGYHRGLDALRAAGWRGTGYVRWSQESNRGFLQAVNGLRQAAEAIGEADEADRCRQLLHQMDPDWDRRA